MCNKMQPSKNTKMLTSPKSTTITKFIICCFIRYTTVGPDVMSARILDNNFRDRRPRCEEFRQSGVLPRLVPLRGPDHSAYQVCLIKIAT